jgi:hypothetical protein
MQRIFLIYFLPFIFLNTFAQNKNPSACSKLKEKGYKQDFCDYNTKYAYKSIPFESNISFVSSKLKLIKRMESPKSI